MKRLIFFVVIFISINCNLKSQNLKWRDIYDCDFSKKNLDLNQDINCIDFFQIKDSCKIDALITWNWTSIPKIENIDSVLKCIDYPRIAERYKISGKILIRFLIDKSGRIYCYKILSELGDVFNQEAERKIILFRFSIACISNKPVAYEYVIPIAFQFENNDKDKKKRNK
ncbi:MAG: energy transducer TonB [Bacteroidia bacterium]|nr:energy transducer TonB [Bacteroidia bacterium]